MASTRSYQGLDHPTSSLRGEEPDVKQHLSPQPDGFRGRSSTSDSLAASPGRHSKRKGEDGPDGRSTPGSPSISLRTTDVTEATESAKRARLGDRQPSGSPAPVLKALTSASTSLTAAPSPNGPASADVPPVSPVVLGFQLSNVDATTRDTVRSALGIKEQQQALILQRRREEQRLAAAKEGANDGESGTDHSDNSSSDEASGKRAAGKAAAGPSSRMTGPSDGAPRQTAPFSSQAPSNFPSTSRQGSASTTPYPQSNYAAPLSTASPAHYPLARSTSASGGPIGSRPSSTNAYGQRPSASALPNYGPANGHAMASVSSPGYQQHPFVQQAVGVAPSRGIHPQPYPAAPTPPSPTSAHKATFLAPFEKFYDALLDSRTLQSSQVALEHKTQDLHRQAAGLVHALEEHHRRAASVLGTLQASSQSLQEMVRAEVAVVRDEGRREMAAVLQRVEELEAKLEEARLKAIATDDHDVTGVPKMEAVVSDADLVTLASEAAEVDGRTDSEVGDDKPLAAAVVGTKRGGRAPPLPPPPARKPSSGTSSNKGRPGSKR